MKRSFTKRMISLFMCVMMLLSVLPGTVFATDNSDANAQDTGMTVSAEDTQGAGDAMGSEKEESPTNENEKVQQPSETPGDEQPTALSEEQTSEEPTEGTSEADGTSSDYWVGGGDGYNSVVLRREYSVAPGVEEHTLYLNDATGNNQNVCHVMEIDLSNPDVDLLSGYSDMDPDNWKTQATSEQAKAAERVLGVNVVGAINTNLSWASNEPIGNLVINGIVHHQGTSQASFVLTNDRKAEIRGGSEPLRGNEWQATSTFQILVQNGVNVYTTPDHATGGRAPRTAIGVKADGSVIMFVVDGRQAPYSVGMTGYELAQTMIDLGCVNAVNCDGGGTSTFVSERAGSGELKVRNSPSDGVERPTLGSLMVVSKAKPTGVFDHAILSPNSDLYTPASSIQFTANGADSSGAPVAIPENVTWRLSESSAAMGAIDAATGLFTGSGTVVGTLGVELLHEGEVVGITSVKLVHPDKLTFKSDEMSLGFSETCELGLSAKYENVDVHYAPSDLRWSQSDETMGIFNADGTYTTNDGKTVSGTINVTYAADPAITAALTMIVGKLPTIVWDFEDVTTVDETTGETRVIPAEEYYTIDKKDENGNQIGLLTTSNYNRGGVQSAEIVSIDDDEPVRMGSHALKLNYDFRNCGAVTEGALVGTTEEFSIPGAPTALGVWVYAPEGTGIKWNGDGTVSGLWLRGYYKDSTGGSTCQYDFTFEPKLFGPDESTWPDEYPGIWWEGWRYCEAKLNGNAPYSILPGMTFRLMFVHATKMGERTAGAIYFDNFQFVYGTNVDDTDAPYVNQMKAYYGTEELDITDGVTVPTNSLGFLIDYMDVDNKYTSGIDTTTTRMYIDGINVNDDAYYNTYTDNDGRNYVYGVTLKNGWHTITAYAKDKAGNELRETRRFLIKGDEDLSAVPDVSVDCAETAAMLGGKMNLTLKASDAAEVIGYKLGLKVDKNFTNYTVTFADGYEGTYRYNKLTGVIQIEAQKISANAGAVVATVAVDVPADLKSWDTFSYSVEYCQYTTAAGVKHTYSKAAQEYDVECMYSVSADPILVGESGVISITSKGAPLAMVGIYKEDGTLLGTTDENGRLTTDFLSDTAADATVYAKDAEGRLSFTAVVSSFAAQGDVTGVPFGVMNHASKDGGLETNVTWFTNPNAKAQKLQYKVSGTDQWTIVNADSARLTFTKGGNSMVSVHSVIVSGLTANTTYVYRVGDGEQWSKEYAFKTDNRDGKVKFFVLGDIQTENLTQVTGIIEQLNAKNYDFGIQTGDAVDDATSYKYWMDIAQLIGADALGGTDMIHVLGNHEFAGDATADRSTKIYNLPASGYGGHYSVEYDNVYVAVINYTSNRQELATALEWLKVDAAKSNAAWKILTIHQPAYYTNTSGGNKEIHDMVPSAAEAAGIDFVFSGHDHSYARTLPMTGGKVDNENGVVYFICGSTGEKSYSVTNNPDFNFARVIDDYNSIYLYAEADEGKIVIRCMERGQYGEELDSFVKEKKLCAEHEYILTGNGVITCKNCTYTEPFETFSGIFFDETTGTYKYAVIGKPQTGHQRITGKSYYFRDDGSAYDGEYTICGETCLFERGTYVSCSTAEVAIAGWAGKTVQFILYKDGRLVFDGEGAMFKLTSFGAVPWAEYRRDVKAIFVGKDITTIGDYAFYANGAESIEFAEESKLKTIGSHAFEYTHFRAIELPPAVESIGGISFGYLGGDLRIVIPEAVRFISSDAFFRSKVTLIVKEGSYAHKWATENGVNFAFEYVKKNGPVGDYFYVDDVMQKAYQLVEYDGDIYFVYDGHKLAKNCKLYLSQQFVEGKTFADGTAITVGYYDFDADGKLVIKNGPQSDGYFYKNGIRLNAYQLVEYKGDIYFVYDGHKLAKNCKLYLSQQFVEGKTFADGTAIAVGYYDFDADGKMIIKN